MDIAFSSDKNYVPYLCTTISSILINSKIDDEFNFYVLDGGIPQADKDNIEKLKSIKPFRLEFVSVDDSEFTTCPLALHFTRAAYYRLKLPSLFKNLDKILYLDCDLIVKKSLSKLYNSPIEEKYALAVEDSICNIANREHFKRILQNVGVSRYFNSGVVVFNLKKMREEAIEQKCFEFIKTQPEKITYVDQCVLNHVFEQNVGFLPVEFNFQYQFSNPEMGKVYKKFKDKIFILHFASPIKPWSRDFGYAINCEYYKYLSKTPYKVGFVDFVLKYKITGLLSFAKKIRHTCYLVASLLENDTGLDLEQKVYSFIASKNKPKRGRK